MALIIRNGKAGYIRISLLTLFFLVFSFNVFGQTTCTVGNTTPTVHAEGLAEQIGDITVSCTGGAGVINTLVGVTLNANITNRLDNNGNLTGVTITPNSGVGFSSSQASLNSPKTVIFANVQFTAGSVSFTISGLRTAVATIGGATPIVNGTAFANGLTVTSPSLFLALGQPTLFSSVLNYGIPCTGSPATALPATVDFNALVGAGTASSTIRITEASMTAFLPKIGTSDSGVRFLVSLSGYGPNAQVYVPDVIVGNVPAVPTSSGAFGTLANGGTYQPNNNQLLLARVDGADATGAGGGPVLAAVPTLSTSFTSVNRLNLVNGAAIVTYEVLAANAGLIDMAQIPVFVLVPPSTCPDSLENTLGVMLAPTSTVSVATVTDSIPRFIATTPASDCAVNLDCAQTYFPVLQIAQTSLTFSGSAQGAAQKTVISVNNGGASQMTYNVSITYQPAAGQSSANWLSASSTTGVVETSTFAPLTFTADPTNLVQGTYQATATINAGSAGTVTLPVTFTVSAPALPSPTIQAVVNAANSQATAAITANSFAAIYGTTLASKSATLANGFSGMTVTFNGANAIVVYDSATQINVLVPASLGSATSAVVVATIDGTASNTFTVSLVPNAPAVFNPGILNQNNSVNLASAPASLGDEIQIFLTGLAATATPPVTVTIGSLSLTGSQIIYAGAVPSVTGLEQVNVQVPPGLTFSGNSLQLSICVPGPGTQPTCSVPVPLYLH